MRIDTVPAPSLQIGTYGATERLELIHGDLVGPMPVESVSRCKYGYVLMDDYFLRAKSDASVEFEKWVTMMQNGTGGTIRTVMFDNARKFVEGGMREFYDERGS